ncbi:MAG: hypothetical protein CVT49_01800 [candidate division Zixibacteria bacterium HGW-Zixibacteria-1]|nr:MAG: hypothetical protein CVT49_01800 [candidate division Zixibacteria bacterium HGW-Zixibacteria-1]
MSNKRLNYFLVSILIFLIFSAVFWSYSIDDAFVTFRYAENFADGHGLTFNPGDRPVEGYSNFLWLLILSLAYLIGLPTYFTAKILGVACFLMAGIVWYRNLSGDDREFLWLAPLFFLANPYTAFWAVSGLELGLYALILALLAVGVIKRAYWSYFMLPLLILIRPEGFVIAIVIIIAGWFEGLLKKEIQWKYYIFALGIIILTFGLLIVFRMSAFGYPMPNTFYVKSTLAIHGFLRLVKGMIYYLPLAFLFMIAMYKIFRNLRNNGGYLFYATVFLAMALINCLADAIMNFHFRYLIAFLPFFLLTAFYGLNHLKAEKIKVAAIILSAVSILIPTIPVYASVVQERKIWGAQKNLIEFVNRQPEQIRISLTDVGRIPYYTKARYNDIWGLVSADIGHEGFNPLREYMRFPDYFVFVGYSWGNKIILRFGKERLIAQCKGFDQTYQYIGAGVPDGGNLNEDGYNYLIYQKNQNAVDSLLRLHPIN